MEELPPPAKFKDLEEALGFGNHKEAKTNLEILKELVEMVSYMATA